MSSKGEIRSSCSVAAVCISLAIAVLAATQAQAQDAGAPAPDSHAAQSDDATANALGDIVVTARRREERLQDVPISITALSGDTLVQAGIDSTRQLAQVTPGLVFARSFTGAQFSLRGVSSRAGGGGDESPIAVYIDGVYQVFPSSSFLELANVDRIEVLRGPQGTLFGRNATGGLINVVTKEPDDTWGGRLKVRYSPAFEERSVNGAVSGPLSDKISIAIAGLYDEDDGYVRQIQTGARRGAQRTLAGNLKLRFQLSDTATITVAGLINDSKDTSALTATTLFNPVLGIPQTAAIQVPGTPITTRPWTTTQNFGGDNYVQTKNAYIKGVFELNDALTLTSTTAYQDSKNHTLSDSDQSALTRLTFNSYGDGKAGTQEFLLTGTSDRFDWTAGLFGIVAQARIDPSGSYSYNAAGTLTTTSLVYAKNITKSWSVFAEGTYKLTDRLSVVLGGRYTWESRKVDTYAKNGAGTTTGSATGHISFDKFTPRVSIKYAITPAAQIYATYSRGFKSGVFNATGAAATATQPENLDSYEGGIKTEPASWLRANLSGFYYNYKDLQVTARTPDERLLTLNAAAARLFGGELEITAIPLRGLEIRAAASYVNDKFTSFPRAVIAVPLPNGMNNSTVPADVTGKHLIRSPRYTLNLGVDYSTHVGGFGDVGFSGNVYRSAKYYWEFSNRLAQPAYTKINAQAWVEPWPKVRLGVWGENLTNAVIEDLVVAGSAGDYAVYQKPRSVGAFIDYQF